MMLCSTIHCYSGNHWPEKKEKSAFLCFSTSTVDAFSCGYLKHLQHLSATQKILFLQQNLLNSQLYSKNQMGDNQAARTGTDNALLAILLLRQTT